MRPKSSIGRQGGGATKCVSIVVSVAVAVAVVFAIRYFWWEVGLILGGGLLAFVSLLISDDGSEGSDVIGRFTYWREGVGYGLKILACWILGAGVGGLSREISRGGYVAALLALALITGLCMGGLSSHRAKTRRRSILLAAVALSAAAALSFFAGGRSFSSAFVGQLLGVMLVAGAGSWGYFGLLAERKSRP